MTSNEIRRKFDPGSFRDRHGRVFHHDGQVYRLLSEAALDNWRKLSTAEFYRRHAETGDIVGTAEAPLDEVGVPQALTAEGWAGLLRHERIPVVSYPYEWPFSMLRDAASLYLELLLAALDEGMTIKDGSSYNVQWHGVKPVFIDIPSFEPLAEGEVWVGYRQFCELFLFPLLLQAYRNVDFHPLLRGRLDGMDAQTAYRLFSFRDWLRPGVLTHAVLQAKMLQRFGARGANTRRELRDAGFNRELIRANARRLKKLVDGLRWKPGRSQWSDYGRTHGYGADDHDRKKAFVAAVSAEYAGAVVWDLGCNTGTFSRIAARHAAYVVAADSDHLAVDRMYHDLHQAGTDNVLPLVADLADSSPNQGWRGLERADLPSRARPRLILCLALIHHAVITANIPLRELLGWLAAIGADVVIEFVDRGDAMVKRLLQNKEDVYSDYELAFFERCLSEHFDVARQATLADGNRRLYWCRRRSG